MTTYINMRDYKTMDFWFTDGNIVLLAGDVAFKVHRGQLIRHSEIFRDMFSLPQPMDETVDGCAWVVLHDDPSDFLHLLRALYDGLYFPRPSSGDFCALSAVLRLSYKYLIEHLQTRCLRRLEADWPAALPGWDCREAQATADMRYSPREHFPHPVHLIRLAQELRLDHLLPAAYYDLSRYGPRKIAAGASPLPPSLPVTSAPPPSAPPANIRLAHADLHATFVGREAGQRFLATFIDRELATRPISAGCANRAHGDGHHCRESYYFIMLNLLRAVSGIATGRDADPLFSLAQASEMLGRTDFSDGTRQCGLRICGACKEDFAGAVASARREAWEMVPVWFGLRGVPVGPKAKRSK
ncbi:uncharacterized protein BXZ73DRAFT_109065 [Epithele typhae]|uniref:uncharacterized protein n=1 Tax=Epithele typhae TaxID=378194 RepID=UPI002007A185|nr:uncharacterized protein BXZ73DRAFT_111027 [Epithele typhae]XP_047870872.1 uncharacterized protein BXZ73DRAFT_109065 [Epithele typhae]KAH9905084.1 hypothetical protein BXZ73DRAFT_111027 [Epithele typhae]KAH9910398.1 hypothetical protein BXZ73DRAFT_109065 [Epithele typhae]